MDSKSNKQKNLEKIIFSFHVEGLWRKKQDQNQESDPDPLVRGVDTHLDPYQNVTIRNTEIYKIRGM